MGRRKEEERKKKKTVSEEGMVEINSRNEAPLGREGVFLPLSIMAPSA